MYHWIEGNISFNLIYYMFSMHKYSRTNVTFSAGMAPSRVYQCTNQKDDAGMPQGASLGRTLL